MPARELLIELDNVHKRYNLGQPNETEVLHGLDLRVARGDFMAFIRSLRLGQEHAGH